MCKLILDRGNYADFTSVSNVFIDEYMPKANGEFVKIYLHLLRLINSGGEITSMQLSTEAIADKFNMLESDVMRALHYWSDQRLLSLAFNSCGQLSGIKLESAIYNRYIVNNLSFSNTMVQDDSKNNEKLICNTLASASGESFSSPVPEASGWVIPTKKKYSAKEIASFSDDERFNQLTFLAQTYLGKTLNSSDINSILYMLEDLGLGCEFIEYIMETCISTGKRSLAYIEKQAVEYTKKGISTIEEAKTEEKLKRAIFKSIYKIFGLAPKAPVKRDISFITKWTDEYGFSDEIIIEACNRTMARTHTGSFEYADGILTNWYKHNAKSLTEIKQLDDVHTEEMNKSLKPKMKTVSRTKKEKSFEQRTYDYKELEKQLIANRDKKLKKTNI